MLTTGPDVLSDNYAKYIEKVYFLINITSLGHSANTPTEGKEANELMSTI